MSLDDQFNDHKGLSFELVLLKLKTYWYLIKPLWWLPIFVACSVSFSTYGMLVFFKNDTYKSGAMLIRHEKNMSSQSDIPYLYLQMDFNTVLQTILLQENLQKVIDILSLDIDPRDLYKRIDIKRGDRSEIIHIESYSSTPQSSAILTNTITDVFLENYAAVQNSAAQKVNTYLDEQINIEKSKLANLQDMIFTQRTSNQTVDLDIKLDKEYVKIKGIELRIIEENIERDALKRKIISYQKKLKTIPSKISIEDSLSSSNAKLVNELQSTLDTLKLKYTEKNPKIIKLSTRIANLEKQRSKASQPARYTSEKMGPNPLYTEIELSLLTAELELIDNSAAIDNYHLQLEVLNKEIQRLNSLKRRYLVDQRLIEDSRSLIIDLERRAQEARFAVDSNISDFDVIQRALVPMYPEQSFRKVIAIVLGCLAFLGSCGFIALRILFKKEVHDLIPIINLPPVIHSFFFPVLDKSLRKSDDGCSRQQSQHQLKLLQKVDDWSKNKQKITVSLLSYEASLRCQLKDLLSILFHQKQVVVSFISSDSDTGITLADLSGCAKDTSKQEYLSDQLLHIKAGDNVTLLSHSVTTYISQEDIECFQSILFNNVDIILWDLYSAEPHNQLYTLINRVSLVVLLAGSWCETNKKHFNYSIQEALSLPTDNIALVLDQVPGQLIH